MIREEKSKIVKLQYLSRFIYRSELLNIIYEVSLKEKSPIIKTFCIGAPEQIIGMIKKTINNKSIHEIEIPVKDNPFLDKILKDKKNTYFRNVSKVIPSLFPKNNYDKELSLVMEQLGFNEVAALPIFTDKSKENMEYILVVLGPLSKAQIDFLKESVTAYHDSL